MAVKDQEKTSSAVGEAVSFANPLPLFDLLISLLFA